MKRAFCVLCALFLLLSALPVGANNSVYISTAEQLAALSARVAAGDSMAGVSVYLTADIALSAPFTPIGVDEQAPFSGSFYGCGRTISGVYVEKDNYAGLFGYVYCGKIDGVELVNATVKGENYTALLVGRLYAYEGAAAVSNCKASGTVNGVCYVGGLVGYACAAAYGVYARAEIKGCKFNGTVNGDIHIGGILGKGDARSTSSRAEVIASDCVANGFVSANGRFSSLAGGICGALSAESNGGSSLASAVGNVSYANVSAKLSASGGICGAVGAKGFGASATLEGGVAFGAVYAAALSGGLAGKCEAKENGIAEVKNSISACNISGSGINAFAAGEGVSGCVSAQDGAVSYPSGITPPVYARGDANGDGVCDNIDAALILKYDAGLMLLGAAALAACDMDLSGGCDNLDAALILKYDAGL